MRMLKVAHKPLHGIFIKIKRNVNKSDFEIQLRSLKKINNTDVHKILSTSFCLVSTQDSLLIHTQLVSEWRVRITSLNIRKTYSILFC